MGELFPLWDDEFEMVLRQGPPATGDPRTGAHFGESYGLIGQGGESHGETSPQPDPPELEGFDDEDD